MPTATIADSSANTEPTTSPRPPLGQLAGALTGSAFEVFDWTIYSTFAAFFAVSFFGANGDPSRAFLESLVVFAVGFLARPLGSIIFGRLSDTRGRRASLLLTSATALVGTLLIALAPTRASIGIGAAIVLVAARIIQGMAHGGEQPAAGAYISEIAQPHNRGAWSSLIYVSIVFGGLLGTLLGAVLTSTLGAAALTAWAWRLPFVVGALGSAVGVFMASRLDETHVYVAAAAAKRPSLLREMVRAWRPALQIIGLTLGLTIAFQNWAAIGGYHIAVLKSDPAAVLWTGVATNVLTIAVLPLWGRLSDRIGRKPVLFVGFGGVVLTSWALMNFLDGSWHHMAIAMGISMIFLAGPLSIVPALMAELVPTSIRTIGVGFSYALATAVFGGTVPALQAWISKSWGPASFGGYVTLAALISLAVVFTIPETLGKDLAAQPTTEALA